MSQLLSLQSAIDQFCVAGKQRGWAPTTQIKYRKFLRYLSDWLRMRGLENTDDLSKALLRQWGADIQDEWGPETVATAVRVVRYWLHWCADEGMASPELVDCLRSPKLPKVIHRTVTPEEIQAMLAVCDTNSQNITIARRNAAIIAMLFDSMVRAAELLALDVSDLDLKGKVIVKGKGGVCMIVRSLFEIASPVCFASSNCVSIPLSISLLTFRQAINTARLLPPSPYVIEQIRFVDQMLAGLASGHVIYVNAFVRQHAGQHSIGRDTHKLSVQAITPEGVRYVLLRVAAVQTIAGKACSDEDGAQASLEVSHSGEWVPVATVEDALDLDSALEMVSEGLDGGIDASVLAVL